VPLVGRVIRARVGELAEESRQGLSEALREVKDDLGRELDARAGSAGAGGGSSADADAVRAGAGAGGAGAGSGEPPPRSDERT